MSEAVPFSRREEVRQSGTITLRMIKEEGLFTQPELRIMGWLEDAVGDWHRDAATAPAPAPAPAAAGTEVAILDDARRELRRHGDAFIAPLAPAAPFSSGPGRHHRPFYDDYEVAKGFIHQALGDLSETDIWDANVLCGVFCRPNVTPSGIYLTEKEVKEDWWQHKVVLVLKMGPDAFQGDPSYQRARFGDAGPPAVGDWLFARPEAGVQISLIGDGASRPQGRDHRGEPMDIFAWPGWPCRIIPHDQFLGRLTKPHSIV